MSTENPYSTPEATVEVAGDPLYQPKFLTASGRIGRLRYLAYAAGINLLFYLLMIPLVGTTAFMGGIQPESAAGIGGIITIALYIVIIVFSIIFGKRRLNDLDRSGWFLLLFLIPIINIILAIYMIFFSGSEGANRFGSAPVANTLGVKILGLFLPVLMLVGIIAAIAIPAYQGYLQRAM
ncbi:MAG: DUF805 domain-containing protein [Sedimenticola sp.]